MGLTKSTQDAINKLIQAALDVAIASGGKVDQSTQAALAAHVAQYHAPTPVPVPPAPLPFNGVSAATFGLKGDGSDEQLKLQAAFDQLSGRTLVLEDGKTYAHSGALRLRIGGGFFSGGKRVGNDIVGGATLLATNPAAMAVFLEGKNTVTGITTTFRGTSNRQAADEQNGFTIVGDNVVLNMCKVDGAVAAGILSQGGSNYHIIDCVVVNTLADAIHNTGGSFNGVILHPYVANAGDDGVAVVSYRGNSSACHDISCDGLVLRGGKARGMSVVGGTNITYTNFDIDGTVAGPLYVASEGDPYWTYPSTHVRISRGKITNGNTSMTVEHGSALMYAGNGAITDVIIDDVDIYTQQGAAPWIVGTTGNPQLSGCVYSNIRCHAPKVDLIYNGTGGVSFTNVVSLPN